jgi:hypothetical protein
MASLLEIFTYPTVAGAKHYCRRLHAFKGASAQKAAPPAEHRVTCYDQPVAVTRRSAFSTRPSLAPSATKRSISGAPARSTNPAREIARRFHDRWCSAQPRLPPPQQRSRHIPPTSLPTPLPGGARVRQEMAPQPQSVVESKQCQSRRKTMLTS